MNNLQNSHIKWKQLLPVLLLALALVTSGTAISDCQPVKGKQGVSLFAKVAADATSSGFSKTGLVLHVTQRFTLAPPAVVLPISAIPVVADFPPVSITPSRSRAPPTTPAFS
jgi:hypothetical protein